MRVRLFPIRGWKETRAKKEPAGEKNRAGVCGFRNDIITPRGALSAEKLAQLPRWMPARININFTTSTDTFSFARPDSRAAGRPRIRGRFDL